MDQQDADFLKRLLETFRVEATEHVTALSSALLELEKPLSMERTAEVVEVIFREAHSMKGAARSVNLAGIERVCQALETVFAALKRKEISPSPPLLDLLHHAVDFLDELLATPDQGASADLPMIRQLSEELAAAAKTPLPKAAEEAEPPLPAPPSAGEEAGEEAAAPVQPALATAGGDTIRITKERLDSLLLQGEAFLSIKQGAVQRATEMRRTKDQLSALTKELSRLRMELRSMVIRGSNAHSNLLEQINFFGEQLTSLSHTATALHTGMENDRRITSTMVDSLLESLKAVSMLPFSSLHDVMAKTVRDLARDRGKQAVLTVNGGEIEIDRRILDEMREPLIHLLRNSIDHGLESPEDRVKAGKSETGTITIEVAYSEGKSIELIIADDGRGIDIAKVRGAAVRFGLISAAEANLLDEEEILSLIFRSGVSASPIITDISGRGLGLAIVRERAERVGGSVSCETAEGSGTIFRIVLPLTLATFRGLLVKSLGHDFIIPARNVDWTISVSREDIRSIESRETIIVNDRTTPLIPLWMPLELPPGRTETAPPSAQAVVLGTGSDRIAFVVDEVLHEQEVLVKSLGPQLARVRNVLAATILGSGKVVPILNVNDLMKSAVYATPREAIPQVVESATAEKSILVVEDSITARSLLRNILDASGYTVETAVDGVDALAALRLGNFNLVVSDVDMPRMNGFELTAHIRADPRLAHLPVVLVTSLQSREDQERGIDVGANAYIIKSSFDQSNLLEVISRLI